MTEQDDDRASCWPSGLKKEQAGSVKFVGGSVHERRKGRLKRDGAGCGVTALTSSARGEARQGKEKPGQAGPESKKGKGPNRERG